MLNALSKRVEAEGWFWSLYFAFGWTKFAASMVNDLLWYSSLPRKFAAALAVSLAVSLAWLFRPWLEVEEEESLE